MFGYSGIQVGSFAVHGQRKRCIECEADVELRELVRLQKAQAVVLFSATRFERFTDFEINLQNDHYTEFLFLDPAVPGFPPPGALLFSHPLLPSSPSLIPLLVPPNSALLPLRQLS